MLGKLMKYEAKALVKVMLPVYAIAAVIMACAKAVIMLGWIESGKLWLAIPSGFLVAISVVAVIATIFISLVLVIVRFYKNLMGDEGYLMFTLPVTSTQLLVSKLICAFVCIFTSAIIIVGGLMLMVGNKEMFSEMAKLLSMMSASYEWSVALIIIVICAGICSNIMLFYTSISLGGHLLSNRLAGSVLAYFGLQMISSVISFVTMAVGGFAMYKLGALDINNDVEAVKLIDGMMISALALMLVMLAAMFLVTRHFLSKKLNLA